MKQSILLLSPGVMERQDTPGQEVAREGGSKEPSPYSAFSGRLVCTLRTVFTFIIWPEGKPIFPLVGSQEEPLPGSHRDPGESDSR